MSTANRKYNRYSTSVILPEVDGIHFRISTVEQPITVKQPVLETEVGEWGSKISTASTGN